MEQRAYLYQLGRRLQWGLPLKEWTDVLQDYGSFPAEEPPDSVGRTLVNKPRETVRVALLAALLVFGAVFPMWAYTRTYDPLTPPYLVATLFGFAFPWLLYLTAGGKKLLWLWQVRPRGKTRGLDAIAAALLHLVFAALLVPLPVALLETIAYTEWDMAASDTFLLVISLLPRVVPVLAILLLLALMQLARKRSIVYLLPLCHGYFLLFGLYREFPLNHAFFPSMEEGMGVLRYIALCSLWELLSLGVLVLVLWWRCKKLPPLLSAEGGAAPLTRTAYLSALGRKLLVRLPFGEMRDIMQEYAAFPVEELEQTPEQVVSALGISPRARRRRLLAMGAGLLGALLLVYVCTSSRLWSTLYHFIGNWNLYLMQLLLPLLLLAALGGRKLLLLRQAQALPLSRREICLLAGLFLFLLLPFVATHLTILTGQYVMIRYLVAWQRLSFLCLTACIPATLYLTFYRTAAYALPLVSSYLLLFAGSAYQQMLHTLSDEAAYAIMTACVTVPFAVSMAALLGLYLLTRAPRSPRPITPPAPLDGEELRQKRFLRDFAGKLLFLTSFGQMKALLRDHADYGAAHLRAQPEDLISTLELKPRGRALRLLLLALTLLLAVFLALWSGSSDISTDSKAFACLCVTLASPPLLFCAMGGRKLVLLGKTQFTSMQPVEIGILTVVHAALYIPLLRCLWNVWLDPHTEYHYVPLESKLLLLALALLPVFACLTYRRSTRYFLLLGNCYLLSLVTVQILSLQWIYGVSAYSRYEDINLQCFYYYLAGVAELVLLWWAARASVEGNLR